MSTKIESAQLVEAHRYFAIECNNKAWSIAEAVDAVARRDELLNLAHASAYHWQAIGTELEKMRATMLLANVHALLGIGESALIFAQQMLSFFLSQSAVPDWELAFVYTIHARASACAGDAAAHADSYAKALAAISAIVDAQDRAIVLVTFGSVPVPGET